MHIPICTSVNRVNYEQVTKVQQIKLIKLKKVKMAPRDPDEPTGNLLDEIRLTTTTVHLRPTSIRRLTRRLAHPINFSSLTRSAGQAQVYILLAHHGSL